MTYRGSFPRSGLEARQGGYTIIELLVVMMILALLAVAAMPLVELSVRRGKERELRHALREMRTAIDTYHVAYEQGRIRNQPDRTGYPPSLAALVEGQVDASKEERKLYFLRRVPRDPFAAASAEPTETWGLRSYESPPDRPSAGADVYDVYSKSDGTGLDGVPYRKW